MKRALVTTLLVSLLIACPALAGQITPPEPPARARCPVCGMFVAKYPDWVASLTFKDATTVYFDGPKDMFTYYLNPGKYVRHKALRHYLSLCKRLLFSSIHRWSAAFYVSGSDVTGPMGKELVPSKNKRCRGFSKTIRARRFCVSGR
jgi:nitrous oxide reductase accessory protein NosL